MTWFGFCEIFLGAFGVWALTVFAVTEFVLVFLRDFIALTASALTVWSLMVNSLIVEIELVSTFCVCLGVFSVRSSERSPVASLIMSLMNDYNINIIQVITSS